MILYDTSPRQPFSEFGIDIPILGSNGRRTVEAHLENPLFAEKRDEWLIEKSMTEIGREPIERAHDPAYVARLFGPQCDDEIIRTFELVAEDGSYHRYDPGKAKLPLNGLFDRSRRNTQGTVEGARIALSEGFCFYLGGGMHHGQWDFGEGFCVINDIVIAAREVLDSTEAKRIWVIDVDAHKGDGTAALTADDESIRTLSIHMAKGWPLDQPKTLADGRPNPSYIPSDIDIPIDRGEEDKYVLALRLGLDRLKKLGPADLAIVLAGSDPYERDQLPSAQLLKMSAQQMLQRDLLVDSFLRNEGVPAVWVMAGNYGPHSWEVYAQFLAHVLTRRYA